jgi:hypothetical protein
MTPLVPVRSSLKRDYSTIMKECKLFINKAKDLPVNVYYRASEFREQKAKSQKDKKRKDAPTKCESPRGTKSVYLGLEETGPPSTPTNARSDKALQDVCVRIILLLRLLILA